MRAHRCETSPVGVPEPARRTPLPRREGVVAGPSGGRDNCEDRVHLRPVESSGLVDALAISGEVRLAERTARPDPGGLGLQDLGLFNSRCIPEGESPEPLVRRKGVEAESTRRCWPDTKTTGPRPAVQMFPTSEHLRNRCSASTPTAAEHRRSNQSETSEDS